MRTYIYLYLFSPVINLYLKKADALKLLYLIVILGFISHYSGTIGQDPSLIEGKNLVTFLFLYSIGFALHKYENVWKKIPGLWYGVAYIVYNVAIVIFFSYFTGRWIDALYYRAFFAYCSFGLLISSILFFLWIGSLNFKSKFVNYIAKSSLAIYMLHCANLIFFGWIGPFVTESLNQLHSEIQIFGFVFLLSTVIVTACIITDKLLTPVWNIINSIGVKLDNTLKHYLVRCGGW